MKKLYALLILGMFCMTFASATWYLPWTWFDDPENNTQQEGKLFIINQEPEWNPTRASEQEAELTFWSLNAKDKKTELGWIVPNGCTDWNDKYLYDNQSNRVLDDKDKDILLKCESSKCDGMDCYHISLTEAASVNIDEYIKLGENSFVTEYQDINTLNYNLDWAEVNVTLYKNISNSWNNTVNSIWINYNNDSYKFGANDSQNSDLENYKYQIKSDSKLYKQDNIIYLKNPDKIHNGDYSYSETHDFNFDDICNRHFNEWQTNETIDEEEYIITHWNDSANCSFEMYEDIINENITDYYVEITFTSDWFIDPTITIGSDDWASTSLFTNVTAEAGNFTHLNISSDAPYDSLVLYMPFDVNSSTVYDWSKESNDGTKVGDVSWNESGIYGGGFEFDGDGDYILVDSDSSLDSQDVTISFWIKPNHKDSVTEYLFSHGAWKQSGYYFYTYTDGLACAFSNSTDVFSVNAYSLFTDDVWQHIIVTFNESKIFYYKNGVPFSDPNDDITLNWTEPTGKDFVIFASDSHTSTFNGSIDEFMIFNTSLTAQQIQDIYNNQSARFKQTGTQKVRATNITNTTNWETGFDSVNLTTTIQENMDSELQARIGQFNFSVDLEGLALYMPFEWGSAVDISGEGNDGALYGGVSWNETGGVNETGSFSFDGTDDYMDIGSEINTNFSKSYTVSYWAKKLADSGTNQEGVNKFAGYNTIGGFNSYFLSSGRIQYVVRNGTHWADIIANNIWEDSEWHFISMIHNEVSDNFSLYVDGNHAKTGNLPNVIDAPSHNLMIGRRSYHPSGYFNGSIDEVTIFNRSLSLTEIQQMYNDSLAKFNTAYYTDYQNISNGTETFTINTEADFVFPEYKFLAGNQSSLFYSPIIEGDITVNAFTSAVGDNPPTYSNIAHNTTIAGASVNFSITWDDDVALNTNGQYIFSTNQTGTWVNESAVNFTSTPQSLSVIKTLNSTVGLVIGYRWFATDNASNSADTGIQVLTTTELSLELTIITPPNFNDLNVSKNEFFNVTVNVTCRGGNCGDVNVSLDPYPVDMINDKTTINDLRETDTFREEKGILIWKKYKSYDASERRLLIEDSKFETILDLKLESNYEEAVMVWSNMSLSAWFDLSDFSGENFIDNVRFYDANNNYTEVFKEYIFKYKERQDVSICDLKGKNCKIIEDDVWVEFDGLSELPNKNIKIGLFIDIEEGDKIEWVIEKEGFEVLEWAIVIGTNAGFVTSAPTSDPTGLNFLINVVDDRATATVDTSPSGSNKITEIGWWCDTASEESNYEVALYSDSESAPGTLLSVSRTNAKGTTAGWKVVTGLDISLDASTTYWLAFQVDNVVTATKSDSSSVGSTTVQTAVGTTTIPSTWTTQSTAVSQATAIYALTEETTSSKSGLINDTIGALPFYTNQSNPRTISLTEDESELVTFWVNATGAADIKHIFFAYANITSDMSKSNITDEWNVTIIEEAVDSCTYVSGDWNVDCSDNCDISSPVDVGGNNIFITGTGTFMTSADITNYGLLHIEGTDVNNICRVRCYGGGCFIN